MVIVFDLDDTLYDEIDFVMSGFRVVAELLDPARADDVFAFMVGCFERDGSGRVFDDTLAHLGRADDVHALVDVYRYHSPDIALPPDRAAVLAELSSRFVFSLVSDGPYVMQRNKFERLGLRALIRHPVFTARLGAPKPAPAGFEAVMRQFAGEREFIYVADNPRKDFVAPRALGWRSVRFRNPRGIHRDAAVAMHGEADHEIDAFAALLTLV